MTGGAARERGDDLVWSLDSVHFPTAMTRWTAHLFTEVQTAVLRRLAEEAGLLLDGIVFREVQGRVYLSPLPLGGRVRRPPPAWLVPVLCRVVPVLRRRLAAARAAEESDLPGRIVREWVDEREDDLLERGRALLATDLDELDGPSLAAHLDRQLALAEEGIWWHFRLHGAAVSLVGSLGRDLAERHGWTAADLLMLFAGLSEATTGPADGHRALVELVREAGALPVLDAATDLRQLSAVSPGVAAAVAGYLDVWGQRAVRYEVGYPTVAERPEWLLQRLQHEALTGGDPAVVAERHAHGRAVAEARLLASLGDTPDTRRRLARARMAYPVREANETATIGVPIAGLRRTGLRAGAVLELERPSDAFDLTFAEVRASLRSEPGATPRLAALAARRRHEREALAATDPPPTIGTRNSRPVTAAGLDGFPELAVRQVLDTLWYLDQVTGAPAPSALTGTTLHGLGVSPGCGEGIARVVIDEDGFERLRPGDVLVCPITSPVWSMVFRSLAGVVCDGGGGMSHPAIIAREFGIPAVVGTGSGTRLIADGARVLVDGEAGTVTVLGARDQPRLR